MPKFDESPLPRVAQELRIEKLVYGGTGLSRFNGQVVLTPYVLPGELVSIKLDGGRKGLLEGEPAAVLEPSAARVEPFCPVFGRCGGCHLQHASYEEQLKQKVLMLRETLARLGKLEYDAEIPVIAGEYREYRNRIQVHFHEGKVGFHAINSHKLVPVSYCPISSPKLNEVIGTLARLVREPRFPKFLRSAELFSNGSEVQINVLDTDKPLAKWFFEWLGEEIPGLVEGPLDYATKRFQFRVGGKSFFQVNRYLIEDLVAAVVPETGGAKALDLYSGVGLFGLHLAEKFEEVLAVESGRSATEDAHFNAQRAGVAMGVVHAPVEEFLNNLDTAPDYLVADPPRAGLGKGVASALLALRPERLCLVSCDPATLARDLAVLQSAYSIERLTLVDLFPNTYHLETVTHLRLQ